MICARVVLRCVFVCRCVLIYRLTMPALNAATGDTEDVAQIMGQSASPHGTTCATTESRSLKTLAIVRLGKPNSNLHAWHARGHRFDPVILHFKTPMKKASSATDWPFFVSRVAQNVGKAFGYARLNIRSNAFLWRSRSAVITWLYVFSVMAGDACPRIFETTANGTAPVFSSIVAAVCLA